MGRVCQIAVLLGITLGNGCAYNPTYFPHWGHMGRTVQTHGKPSGPAYFKDFDPKAQRIEVTPMQCSNRVGKQQVLIATVYDADGQPRRSRRVEWILDGPGYIVEVDESGWLPGRGYKVDNKYAVSFTDYRQHTFTRGTEDPRDDFRIEPGQTWCVVSSAVEGLTTITAYAPEVFDWEKGRVTVRLNWADSQFRFPPPVTARSGGEADLTTVLSRYAGQENPDNLKVRYRVLDGASASLMSRTGEQSTSQSGPQTEAEVLADSEGKAAVRVVQPSPQVGTTRIAVEVIKPDPGGSGAGEVVGRQETTVQWAAPELAVDVQVPRVAGLDRDTTITVLASNNGAAETKPVQLSLRLPEGVEFVHSDPNPAGRASQNRGELEWNFGPLAGGNKQSVQLTVRPQRKGSFPIVAIAETAAGLRSEKRVNLQADVAGLTAALELPAAAAQGEKVPVRVAVTNPSGVFAENVTAWINVEGEAKPVEVAVGNIAPGETKRADATITAEKLGPTAVRASVTADGGLNATTAGTLTIQTIDLVLSLTGPEQLMPGEQGIWTLTVMNRGTAPVEDVVGRVTLPTVLSGASVSETGKLTPDGAEWPLGTLAAGERKAVHLTAAADRITERGILQASLSTNGGSLPRVKPVETIVKVVGQPAVVLEFSEVPATITTGRRAQQRITVRNRGTGPAKKIVVSVQGSDELAFRSGIGPDRRPARTSERGLVFEPLDELPAGATAVYIIDLATLKPGLARLEVELSADHLTQPLRDQQTAQVISR